MLCSLSNIYHLVMVSDTLYPFKMSQSSASHCFSEKARAPLHVADVIVSDTMWKMLLRAKMFIMGEFAVRKNVPVARVGLAGMKLVLLLGYNG